MMSKMVYAMCTILLYLLSIIESVFFILHELVMTVKLYGGENLDCVQLPLEITNPGFYFTDGTL